MKWYRNTWSIYYGDSSAEGSMTINDVVVGPFLYNDKLYGIESRPAYGVYLQAGILDQNYIVYPVQGHAITSHYYRVVGVSDDRTIDTKWGEEIKGDTISGQYKFSQNIAGTCFGGWDIPCNFILVKKDGTVFQGDSLRAPSYADRFPSYSYCGITWRSAATDTALSWGSSSTSVSSVTLAEEDQYAVVDFGATPQPIPEFIKEWIEWNAEPIVTPTAALTLTMKSNKGFRLQTAEKYCDRDIQITPILQERTFVANGEFVTDFGYVGISKVIVNVPEVEEYEGEVEVSGSEEEPLDPEFNHYGVIPEGWTLEYVDSEGEWQCRTEGEPFPDKSIYAPDGSVVYYSGADHYYYGEDGWHYDEIYGEDQEVIILESIDDIPVTTIDNLSGQMGTSAISATIPTSITKIIGVGEWMGTSKLTSIIYLGTMDQWNAITLEDGWNQNCPEITVTCTDGTITIPAYGS